MNNIKINSTGISQQRGATLIVSLVILAVITVIGIASMRSANMELKMAASARDRAVALQAAESALRSVETLITTPGNGFTLASLLPSCKGDDCFTFNCNNGRCFGGDLEVAATLDDCSLASLAGGGGNAVTRQYWNEDGIWEDAARTGDMRVLMNNGVDIATPRNVQFLIEFMCFVPKNEKSLTDPDHASRFGVPLYQVTVQSRGEAGRSVVMLQSIFKSAQ
jgi:type IV pilus assembly protein PilX